VAGLSSKRWDVFAGPDTPVMDVIITVCDAAAGEACPLWPGHPLTSHWGMPDPAAAPDAASARAPFATTYDSLHRFLSALVALPLTGLAPADAKAALERIGTD
jgi:arsenate reductase (thioredoxin)